jgi:1,4-dihydroxy-6-naphthoate synthase
VVVARRSLTRDDLAGMTVAIPGKLTSARLVLQLWQPAARRTGVPFDAVMDVVRRGEADAGVVIHEGQLTFADEGWSCSSAAPMTSA